MEFREQLGQIARRLKTDTDDLRHTVLETSGEFFNAVSEPDRIPANLRDEVREILAEMKDVQPRFPSHRQTSVLFDREGLGQTGRGRAKNLALRIIAVCEAVGRGNSR